MIKCNYMKLYVNDIVIIHNTDFPKPATSTVKKGDIMKITHIYDGGRQYIQLQNESDVVLVSHVHVVRIKKTDSPGTVIRHDIAQGQVEVIAETPNFDYKNKLRAILYWSIGKIKMAFKGLK